MTNVEAIKTLSDMLPEYELRAKYNGEADYLIYCAIEMGIKALEREQKVRQNLNCVQKDWILHSGDGTAFEKTIVEIFEEKGK